MGLNLNFNKNSGKSSNPLGGIILGIILLIAGTVLLWWNEGNNVKNIQAVKEVSKAVVDVSADSVDSANDGKVICISSDVAIADDDLVDPVFSVSQKTAKLSRIVEMYQWEEEEHHNDNNVTTHTYKKVWSDDVIDSSKFAESGHENSATMPYNSENYYASDVSVGAFKLSKDQIAGLGTNAEKSLDQSMTVPEGYKVSGQYITNSADLNNPNIGDIRVSYKYNDYKSVSVLAVQRGNSFVAFTSASGKSINRVENGILTSAQIINKITDENNTFKWLMRLLGIIMVILGYLSIVSPISKLASFVPILGGLVGGALALVSFLIGLAHSLVVIAVAWIRFRPLLGIALLAVVVALIVMANRFVKKKQTE